MTVCNMSIEAGARAGMIAPDETTFDYLRGRPRAPEGARWDRALDRWRRLPSDAGAGFDRVVDFDAAAVAPMITYGTNPGMAIPLGAPHSRCATTSGVPEGARITWDSAPASACRQAGGRRIHRQLYQLAAVRPAKRRCALARPPGGARRADAGRAGFAAGQAGGRSRGLATRCSRRRAPNGASRAARCASA